MDYGKRLYESFQAGQTSQSDIMRRIGNRGNAERAASSTIEALDGYRDRSFSEAEKKAGGNRRLLVKLKMPIYQWHVRAKTVLAVIAAGRWSEVAKEPTYAAMYAKSALIVRPTRKRTRGTRPLAGRQVATVERIVHRADAVQAGALLEVIAARLKELHVPFAKDVLKVIEANKRPVLIPLRAAA